MDPHPDRSITYVSRSPTSIPGRICRHTVHAVRWGFAADAAPEGGTRHVESGGSIAGGCSVFSCPGWSGDVAAASVGAGDGSGGRGAPHACQVPPSFPSTLQTASERLVSGAAVAHVDAVRCTVHEPVPARLGWVQSKVPQNLRLQRKRRQSGACSRAAECAAGQ